MKKSPYEDTAIKQLLTTIITLRIGHVRANCFSQNFKI